MTSDLRIPEPFFTLYAVSKKAGLVPTIAYSSKAGGFVEQLPLVGCHIDDVQGLASVLKDRLSRPIALSEMSFEEAKTGSIMEGVLNLASAVDVEKNTVFLTIAIDDGKFDLQIFGRSGRGTWLDAPYALDVKIPFDAGFETVAKMIVEHIQVRKDLPDEVSLPIRSLA